MVQRTVSVGLIANVNNYVANMNRAADATRKSAAAMVGSEKQLRAQGEVFTKLGTSAMAGGAIAAAGLALVIKKTAEFDSKMAQLQTVLGASKSDMKQLSSAAMEQGKAFGYSASQVADAQIELAKAGVTVKQQLGGALKGSLALAASGQIDVADATSISVQAMSQFKLEAKDLPHVADLLSAGAANTTASVDSLGQALSQSGGVAHQFGISLDDTVGVLSLFDQNALKGSDGGTAFKSMLLALASPSTVAKKKIDELGISAYDANGNFVGVTKYAQILQDRLKKLTPEARNAALGIVFGSDAARAAGVFYDAGAKKLGAYIKQNQVAGYASAQAAGKLNSLSGDVQKLGAAFDTNLIKAGSGANDVLRDLVQTGSGVLDTIGAIPAPVLTAATTLTALTAGAGLLGGGLLVARVKVSQFRKELGEANVSGKKFAGTFGKGGAVLLGLTAIGAGLSNLNTEGTASTQQLGLAADQLRSKWKGIDNLFPRSGLGGLIAGTEGTSGLKASLDQLNGDWWQQGLRGVAQFTDGVTGLTGVGTHLSDVYKSNAQTFDAIGQQLAGLAKQDLPAAQASFNSLNGRLGGTRASAKQALSQMTPYRDALVEIAGKAGVVASESNLLDIAQRRGAASATVMAYQEKAAAAGAKEHAAALGVLAGAADDGTTSVKALGDAIENLDGGQLSARDAARQYEAAVDAATDALKKNGKTLDINTEAGRDNQAHLDGIAEGAKESASAYLKMSDDAAGASKILRTGRKDYVNQAVAMGMTRSAANKLAASIFAIPKAPKITVKLDDAAAQQRIRETRDALMKLNGAIATVYVKAVNQSKVPTSVSGALIASGKAAGGAIDGDGPKGVDSVPTILAPGEHVLTADDVDAMGGQSNVYAFRDALHMAKGGAVPKRGRKPKKPPEQNAVDEQKAIADAAAREIAADTKAITAAKRRAKQLRAAADRAAKAYDAVDGSKKNRAAKLAAKAAKEAADKRADAAEKRIDTLGGNRDDAKQKRESALSAAQKLRDDREDFVSGERRGVSDPLSYVDTLRSMSRDENFSDAKRKRFKDAANDAEKMLVDLAKQGDEAATKLSDLKQSSEQMAGSIASSIAGRYAASNASSVESTSGWMVQDGIQFQTTTSAITAASLESYFGNGASETSQFASQLQQLAARGVDGRLLAEIAQDPAGPQMAAALLSASTGQIDSINRNYSAIQGNAAAAGQGVADVNFRSLIESAQANTDRITKQLADDSAALRKLIADAFGLPGYAIGTTSATPGLHLVGEQGPELLRFGGGEQVYTATQTAYLRGSGAGGGRGAGGTGQTVVQMPDTITVQDASGFELRMRVVAKQEIHSNAAQGAVALLGRSA